MKLDDLMTGKHDGHYDLSAAIEYNGIILPFENFNIVSEILSECHDEGEYYWLIKNNDKNNEFVIITGSHDYTGWDCQSGASISEIFGTEHLQLHAPEYDNKVRPIRQMMIEAAARFIHDEKFTKEVEKIKNESN